MATIHEHEGKKYLRQITSVVDQNLKVRKIAIDVYCVIEAFDVRCPAMAHAIKKVLCAGSRGKGSVADDIRGAIAALNRALELEQARSLVASDSDQTDELRALSTVGAAVVDSRKN